MSSALPPSAFPPSPPLLLTAPPPFSPTLPLIFPKTLLPPPPSPLSWPSIIAVIHAMCDHQTNCNCFNKAFAVSLCRASSGERSAAFVTVAILAQGTHWAVATSQAFFFWLIRSLRHCSAGGSIGPTISPGEGARVARKGVVAHQALVRGLCIAFWLSVPSLQVALGFACSVASLRRCPSL